MQRLWLHFRDPRTFFDALARHGLTRVDGIVPAPGAAGVAPPKERENESPTLPFAGFFFAPAGASARPFCITPQATRPSVTFLRVLPTDEQAGRAIALGRNLPTSGTLGVLERADTQGFVSDFS